jgi:hypothetical protein
MPVRLHDLTVFVSPSQQVKPPPGFGGVRPPPGFGGVRPPPGMPPPGLARAPSLGVAPAKSLGMPTEDVDEDLLQDVLLNSRWDFRKVRFRSLRGICLSVCLSVCLIARSLWTLRACPAKPMNSNPHSSSQFALGVTADQPLTFRTGFAAFPNLNPRPCLSRSRYSFAYPTAALI